MTSAATAPDRHLTRRARAVVALGGAALALAVAAPGSGTAGAQILGTTIEAPATTAAPTTAPPETTTTAPPSAPSTIPVTTVPVDDRARITQDTPDLGGVLVLWGIGILGTLATLAWSWHQNRS